jgi:cyclophilin family peptidyl-prolyl cis-trans isomerase
MKRVLQEAKPIIILLLVCALITGGMVWIINGGLTGNNQSSEIDINKELPGPLAPEELAAYDVDIENDMNPVAVIKTNKGIIEIELFEDLMPITAGNFIKLAEEDYFDGVKFHRVIEGFMIQGGDPLTKGDEILRYGTGGPGYSIHDEHIRNDKLTNIRGTIAMANSGPNSGGSQFFINLVDNQRLDFDKPPASSKHPVFGQVVAGMDVVDAIAQVEVNATSLPLEDVVMEEVTIRRDS